MIDKNDPQYQEAIKNIAIYRLKRIWSAAGFFAVAAVYLIFIIMINTADVAKDKISTFNSISISLIVALQFLVGIPHVGKLAKMTAAYPDWKKDLKEEVSLSFSDKMVNLLPGLFVLIMIVVAFNTYYVPGSRPKPVELSNYSYSTSTFTSEEMETYDSIIDNLGKSESSTETGGQ